jgi:putative tricarboxylic transport membrane protein
VRRGELVFAVGVTLAGVALGVATALLPAATATNQVGPQALPAVIAAGLIVCGLALLHEARTGGFRNLSEVPSEAFDGRAFAWISAGVLGHMLLIGIAGFVAASTLLVVAVARGFGSERVARDAVVGIAMAATLYAIFTFGLGLSLGPMLGAMK